MEKFFNSDNGVMRALSKLFDMGVLTLIYLVFCIPVVTIGAATTSLYYVSAKVLRHNRSYVWTEFWSSFEMNFAQSTVVWLLIAGISLLLVFNMQLVGVTDTASAKGGYLAGVYFAMLIFISCISCYVFPFISRFSMKLGQILRLSLYCAFRHFLHTLSLIAIVVAMAVLIYVAMITNIIIIFLFAPALASFVYTFPMEHIMKKYMPKEEPKYTEEGEEIIPWYNE